MNISTPYIKDFIRHLLSAIANVSLYGMDHPQVIRLSSQAFDNLAKVLDERNEFTLIVIENELLIDGQPQEFSLFLNRFAQILSSRGIGHIRLISGISRPEINSFVASFASNASIGQAINSSEHLRLGWVELKHSAANISNDGVLASKNDLDTFAESCASDALNKYDALHLSDIPRAEIERFREVYETVKHRHKLKINGIIEIVSSFIKVYRQEGQALLVMAALRNTDEYTFTHSTNVSILNIAQAAFLGIEGQMLNDIGVAGMLHDIGKLFIPEEILTKNSSLTAQELEIIQTHPVKGARYLLGTPGVPRLAVINAFEHHLKHDLSGYPAVPDNWKQNICSQITAISDIFDALRTRRSYRQPMELNRVLSMMQQLSGTELHPALTNNFLTIISSLKIS